MWPQANIAPNVAPSWSKRGQHSSELGQPRPKMRLLQTLWMGHNHNHSNHNHNNNNNNKEEEEEQEQEQEQEQAQKCDKKMCGKMVTSCGMTRTSHCALPLRARTEHMNNTNAHTTIHNPYGIAGVRSSTIYM